MMLQAIKELTHPLLQSGSLYYENEWLIIVDSRVFYQTESYEIRNECNDYRLKISNCLIIPFIVV